MGTRRILVISPVPTHPLNAGNRARIVGLIESLKALEFSVFFLHVQQEIGSSPEMEKIWGRDFKAIDYQRRAPTFYRRCKKKMQRIFNMPSMFSYSIDEWYDSSIEKRVLRIVDECEIDTVIVEYVWYSKILEVLDKRILKIIDTHDQFANRHLHYLEKGEKPRWFSTTPKEEAKGFNRADVILAIQDSEKDKFKKLTKAKVLTVGHVVPITKYRKYEDTNGYILFVASENQINL
ncbi:MAG: hypothetical protein KUG75_08885, partial [Pseudomonadales bacterium]|nr:hypothetical protein [Pseudomonadales bacterium]